VAKPKERVYPFLRTKFESAGRRYMLGVVRFLALGLAAGTLVACQTDSLVGPEANTPAAKPRVIDTRKTLARSEVSKKEANKPPVSATRAAPAQGDSDPATTSSVATSEKKNTERTVVASIEPAPASAPTEAIPARSLFGNWTLGDSNSGRKCRLILGGVLIGSAYSARSEADCPPALTAVQSWEIQGDQLLLRNQSRAVVGRLQPTGPFRFDGQAEGGVAVYLVR
jgi:hypothetical protein